MCDSAVVEFSSKTWPAALLLVFLLALASCKDDAGPKSFGPKQTTTTTATNSGSGGSGGQTATGSTTGQGGLGSDAGKMTITAEGLDAYEGSKLVVLVADANPTDYDYGAICETVLGPDHSVSAVVSKLNSQNPCDLGGPVTLEPKDYFVFAGLFKPGAMQPDGCMEVLAEVNGDVTVELPPVGACN